MSAPALLNTATTAPAAAPSRRVSQKAAYSDFETENRKEKGKQNRSSSLVTLNGTTSTPPKMAQLETLEAKMASIEVSLSASPRRRRGCVTPTAARAPEIDSLRTALKDKEQLIQSLKEQLCTTLSINRMSARLSSGGTGGAAGATPTPGAALAAGERAALVARAQRVSRALEEKRQAIERLKQALDGLDITDNIDTRIQQAELEYQLGREELELLTLMEQSRALQVLIEQADAVKNKVDQQTIYGCILEMEKVTIHAVEVEYDSKSPKFGTSTRRGAPGFFVEWALDNCPLCKGDRLVEVNGKVVTSGGTIEELTRLLNIAPSPAQLVVLRTALPQTDMPSARSQDALRADNLRLTHRISYLEEQVAELLARDHQPNEIKVISHGDKVVMSTVKTKQNVTNINITSDAKGDEDKMLPIKSDVQVFQKGPDITAIVANLPGLQPAACPPLARPRSGATNISNTHITSPIPHKQRSPLESYPLQTSKSSHSLDHKGREKSDSVADRKLYRMRQSLSHHCISGKENVTMDYQAETAAALEVIKRNQKHYLENPLRMDMKSSSKARSDDNFDIRDKSSKWGNRKSTSNMDFYDTKDSHRSLNDSRSTDGLEDYGRIKKCNWAERKTLSIIEQLKQSQRLRKSKSKSNHIEDIDFNPERDYIYHRIDGKVLENTHKSSRRLSKLHVRNVKSLEFDSENSDINNGRNVHSSASSKIVDYTSEPSSVKLGYYKKNTQQSLNGDPKSRPMPPKKPLRLSLHRAQSAQSVDSDRQSDLLETNTNVSTNNDNFKLSKSQSYDTNNKLTNGTKDKPMYSEVYGIARNIEKCNQIVQDIRKPSKRNHKGDTFVGSDQAENNNQNTPKSPSRSPRNYQELRLIPHENKTYADENPPNRYQDSVTSEYKYNFVNNNSASQHRAPSRSDSTSSRAPSRAESTQSSSVRWAPTTPIRNGIEQTFRYNGHTSNVGKW